MWATPIGLIVILAASANAAVTGYSGTAPRSTDGWRTAEPTTYTASAYGRAATDTQYERATAGSELWTSRTPTAAAWRTVGAHATASAETPRTPVAYAYSTDSESAATGTGRTAWQPTGTSTAAPRASTTWQWHSTYTDTQRAESTRVTGHSDGGTSTEHSAAQSSQWRTTDHSSEWRTHYPSTAAASATGTDATDTAAAITSSESSAGGGEAPQWHKAVRTYSVAALFAALGVVMLLAFAVAALRSCCGKARGRRKRSLLDDDAEGAGDTAAGN